MEARKPLTPTQVEVLTQERGVPRVRQLRPETVARYTSDRVLRGD
jgi:hypothetical protein